MQFDPVIRLKDHADKEMIDGDWCREQGHVNEKGDIKIPPDIIPNMLTVGAVCIRSLMAPMGGAPETAEALITKSELATQILAAMNEEAAVEMESKHIVIVDACVLKTYNTPSVYPFVHRVLEQKDAAQSDRSSSPTS